MHLYIVIFLSQQCLSHYIFIVQYYYLQASLVAQTVKHLPAMQETRVRSLSQEDTPGEGNGNPLQYSCLENPMERGAWWAAVHGVAKSRTRLSGFTFTLICFVCMLSLQSCLTLCNPMDCSPPGSSVHGILQARVLEWGAIAFSSA